MGQEQSTLGGGGLDDPGFRGPFFQQYHEQPLVEQPAPEEEVIDIYDTGVSAGLRALLATLHDEDSISAASLPSTVPALPKLSPAAPAFVPTAARWNAAAPVFVPSSSADSVSPLVEVKTWWYKDPKGVSRGAFSTAEMKNWFDQKYFPADLFVARDEFGPYMPLSALYPEDGVAAFAKYMDVREFNLKLQAYL